MSDSSFTNKYKQLIRGTVIYCIAIWGLYRSDSSIYLIALVCLLLIFLLWSTFGRQAWGDKIVLSEGQIELSKGELKKNSIIITDISKVICDKRSIAIAWIRNGKRKSVIIAKESFTDETFSLLASSLKSIVSPDVLEDRT